MRDRRTLFMATMIGLLVLDQLVKAWARHTFDHNLAALGSRPFPGFFELTLTYNEGIAFGMFQGHGVLLAPVAIAMAIGAWYYSRRHPEEPTIAHLAMGLLAAGALGNLYDRLVLGKVTDMFYFRAINFPVFNVADACITIAAILLIYTWAIDAVIKERASQSKPDSRPDSRPVT